MGILVVNGVEYISKDSIKSDYIHVDLIEAKMAEKYDGMQYVLIRSKSAGVFVGYLSSYEDQQAIVRCARRIYYWDGAATVSQLAIDGTSKPDKCKFPEAVDKITVEEVIEVIPMTQKAKDSILSVRDWKE